MSEKHNSDRERVSPARVLHVVGYMGYGGAEAMVMTLYRALDRTKWQFDFLVFGEEEGVYESEIRSLGGRVFRMTAPSELGARRTVSVMASLMRAQGPFTAVHTHIYFASSLALVAARRARVPVRVAHSHNTADNSDGLKRRLYRLLSRAAILRTATAFVACGEEAGLHMFGRRWRSAGQVLHNSIDVERFVGAPDREGTRLRDEWGAGRETVVLGSVGRLVSWKNHRFLLQLIAHLRTSGEDVMLALVGEGPMGAALEAEAQRLEVEDRVLFLGARRDVPELMRAFDVLALPSEHEGLPVVLIEAQASGLHCLVSDTTTDEVDLGLGLIDFLSLEDSALWADRLTAGHLEAPAPDALREGLVRRGYTAETVAAQLAGIYGGSS